MSPASCQRRRRYCYRCPRADADTAIGVRARSRPFAPDSGVARRVVGCVFRRVAGSQHTTTRHASHAQRRRRHIRPYANGHSALASHIHSIAAVATASAAVDRVGRRGWRGKRSLVLTSADAPGTRRPMSAIPGRRRRSHRYDERGKMRDQKEKPRRTRTLRDSSRVSESSLRHYRRRVRPSSRFRCRFP